MGPPVRLLGRYVVYQEPPLGHAPVLVVVQVRVTVAPLLLMVNLLPDAESVSYTHLTLPTNREV